MRGPSAWWVFRRWVDKDYLSLLVGGGETRRKSPYVGERGGERGNERDGSCFLSAVMTSRGKD